MPFTVIRGDITKLTCDAIVNAANSSLLGGGGVDGAIHRAAGPGLLAECRTLGGCRTGEAKITGAYRLPCKYVIHTVGPVWQGGDRGEEALLTSCYRASLALAAEKGCESVAFPLISSGVYGYPKEEALRVAEETIRAFLETHEMNVILTVFDKDSFRIGEERFREITAYIDDHYAEEKKAQFAYRRNEAYGAMPTAALSACQAAPKPAKKAKKPLFGGKKAEAEREDGLFSDECFLCDKDEAVPEGISGDLADRLKHLDESFSQSLLRLIDEKGMTDAACYKKANIDRKHFSKIRSDPDYRPGKRTVLSLAVALELNLAETEALLSKAGFALSASSKADVILRYFIERKNYDLFEINNALFAFDQELLGA
ncbi:MAG: O-acetyl-ADP-ribose deacetylase [Lachnospiraceae bacterium]|nr:O-acetyl-ADP-ribose deacetylase [Lachnospiraceae bacterium]